MRAGAAGGMEQKPIARQLGHLLQCARFFEEMRRAGHDDQLMWTLQLRSRLLVEIEDDRIAPANNEQRRRPHLRWHRR